MSKTQLKNIKILKRHIKNSLDIYNLFIFKISKIALKNFKSKYKFFSSLFFTWRNYWLILRFINYTKQISIKKKILKIRPYFLFFKLQIKKLKKQKNNTYFLKKKRFFKKDKIYISKKTNLFNKSKKKKYLKNAYKYFLYDKQYILQILFLKKKFINKILYLFFCHKKFLKKNILILFYLKKNEFLKIFFHVSEGAKSVRISNNKKKLKKINLNLFFLSKKLFFIKNQLKIYLNKNTFLTTDNNETETEDQKFINNFYRKYPQYRDKESEIRVKYKLLDYNKLMFNLDAKNKPKKTSKWRTNKNKVILYKNLNTQQKFLLHYYNLNTIWYKYQFKFNSFKWKEYFFKRIEIIIQQSNFIDNIYFITHLLKNCVFFINNIICNTSTFFIKKHDYIFVNTNYRYIIYNLILKRIKYNIWCLIWYIFLKLDNIIFFFIKKPYEILNKNHNTLTQIKNIKFLKTKFFMFKNKSIKNLEINYKLLVIYILEINKVQPQFSKIFKF